MNIQITDIDRVESLVIKRAIWIYAGGHLSKGTLDGYDENQSRNNLTKQNEHTGLP